MTVVFDKLSFVKRLEDAGTFSRPQAETLSDPFHQAVSETVATKQDVESVRSEIRVWTVSLAVTIVAVLSAMKYFG